MSYLNFSVKALDDLPIDFIPDKINIIVGQINDDLQTCRVDFELCDNGVYDPTVYNSLQRVIKGNVNMDIAVISQVKTDDTINTEVVNLILSQFNLTLK